MIFVMYDYKSTDLAAGFKAIEGLEPIKLPDTMGVMDLSRIQNDAGIDDLFELSDATSLAIVFAPSGRLMAHKVRVRNRDGESRPANDPGSTQVSRDDVFNSAYNICRYRQGMFIQDDYSIRNPQVECQDPDYGLGQEDSCMGFVIYEAPRLRTVFEKRTAWTEYLGGLATKAIYVSPYTGALISSD
jgi:hypothetical protein